MASNLEILDIDSDAARQYIDANAAFTELQRSKKNALQVRGGMVWKTVDGKEYLIRTSATGALNSIGRRSAETEAINESFTAKKHSLESRVSSLKVAVAILNRLANAGLDEYFLVVGTRALYAYEAASGVRLASEITPTRDIDLLWDTRKRVMFAQRLAQDAPSMLAYLKRWKNPSGPSRARSTPRSTKTALKSTASAKSRAR